MIDITRHIVPLSMFILLKFSEFGTKTEREKRQPPRTLRGPFAFMNLTFKLESRYEFRSVNALNSHYAHRLWLHEGEYVMGDC